MAKVKKMQQKHKGKVGNEFGVSLELILANIEA